MLPPQILLDERGRGLVVAVATNQQTKEEEHIADGTVLDHVCTVLSHCICRPQALADVLLQPQQGLRCAFIINFLPRVMHVCT